MIRRRGAARRMAAAGLAAAISAAMLWSAGFAWFLRASWAEAAPPPRADGIVALTGGAGRVETALRLLADGRARLLLVSGVGGAAEFSELARRAGVDPHLAGRVTLGRAAASTRGNAAEAAEWARGNAIHSLIVVTAGYHMPRALAELGRTLPDVTLHAVPVQPPGFRDGSQVALLRFLASEYTKYLAAELGLSGLGPHGTVLPDQASSLERHG